MKNPNGSSIKKILIENNTYLIFAGLFVVCCFMSPSFFTPMNLTNIMLQQIAPILVAIGMLFVILTGGIDLSVGSIMALGASLCAILITEAGMAWGLAIIVSVAVCALLGIATGILVAYLKFQGFVASLAMMTIARGIAFMLTNGSPIKMEDGTLNTLVKSESGYPILIIGLVIILAFIFIQHFTSYGRIVIATGSNITAVELAGIRVKKYVSSVYIVSAVLSAFAGILVAARSSTGTATIGDGQELDAIAACVIGGASLAGGSGDVLKAVFGSLVLSLITNIMNLCAVPAYPQDVIKGLIIVGAVLLQVTTNKKDETV